MHRRSGKWSVTRTDNSCADASCSAVLFWVGGSATSTIRNMFVCFHIAHHWTNSLANYLSFFYLCWKNITTMRINNVVLCLNGLSALFANVGICPVTGESVNAVLLEFWDPVTYTGPFFYVHLCILATLAVTSRWSSDFIHYLTPFLPIFYLASLSKVWFKREKRPWKDINWCTTRAI